MAMLPEDDILCSLNTTTLGPYSFQVFVSVAWTEKHCTGVKMPLGRRPSLKNTMSNRKRPLAKDIKQETAQPKKRRRTENLAPLELIIGQIDRRTTRSQQNMSG